MRVVCALLITSLHHIHAFLPSNNVASITFSSRKTMHANRHRSQLHMQSEEVGDSEILLRVARGEAADRSPVWLMRQAGRYMADFRKYSDRIPFRERAETPDIAIELSLQPWRKFGVDGVIMFSDILTPLPALGIEFDVVKGTGPIISDPVRSMSMVDGVTGHIDPDSSLPFIRETLSALKNEIAGRTTLLGFVGAPFTLAAYSVEGKANKNCITTKQMMYQDPQILHALLSKLSDAIADYACYQIDCGAQVIQFFESWAHHLSPEQFLEFSKPYAERAMAKVKARHPHTPVIFFANGGSSYLELQRDLSSDMISLDWAVDMARARDTLGWEIPVSGNVDPMILFGGEAEIRKAVRDNIRKAGSRGHILNLGHGVLQGTPEENVQIFVDEAKKFKW